MQKPTLRDLIRTYVPASEQEKRDKSLFLKWMERPDVLCRSSEAAHVTASAFVMDETLNYVLMAWHRIYRSYAWLGGHADGQEDLMAGARREACEESGIRRLTPMRKAIAARDVLPVPAHVRRGQLGSEHLHLNATWLFTAPMDQTLAVKEDENTAVSWIAVSDLPWQISEADMLPVYRKLIATARRWRSEDQ